MDSVSLEARARAVLDPAAYDYFAGGADDEVTLAANSEAWRRILLLPHVLRDVSAVSAGAEVLGIPMTAPILIAPMAVQKLAHPGGESAMAQAAARTGTVMVVSTMATISLEDVAASAPDSPRWFQLYCHRGREVTVDLVQRAQAAGYRAIVLTVDVPVLSRRRRDEANRFDLPDGMRVENLATALYSSDGSALAEYTNASFDAALTPDDIGWIASIAGLPVIVKGILRADDALRAVYAGAAAVIVSNHGGRQLDGAIASADALPAVAAAVAGRVPVLVDGGIRGGYDVVKAIALGASAVLVGRPFLWGLALGGSDGAATVMTELIDELVRTMTLCGVSSIDQIDGDLLALPG